MEKCMQTKKHKYTFTTSISSWQCNYSKKRLLIYRLEYSSKTTDISMRGWAVRNHGWPRVEDNNMPHGQLRASCCSKVIHQFWSQFIVNIDIAGFVFTKSSPRAKWRTSPRRLVRTTIKNTQKIKRGMAIEIRTTVCEIFLNDRSACTRTQFSDSERPSNVVSKSRKHSFETHFPEDRNCQVCLQTKMTRPPCRRRTGKAPPRAEKFGDLITADHKVLNEEGESRNNLRHAVVVQDLATQWIQSYFTRDGKEFTKVPRAVTKAKTYLDAQILEVWKILWRYIKESSNFNTSSVPVAEGAVRRVKGTSAVLLQSGLDEKWWAGSMECYCFLRNVQELLAERKLLMKEDLENH